MGKLAVYTDESGNVIDIFRATPDNCDFFEDNGKHVPANVRLFDEGTEVELEDTIDSKGRIDTVGHLRAQKRRDVANMRYQREIGGVELRGMNIATDRESQALITGAALQATVDEDYTCQWKTQGGFVSLSAQQIIGIAQAVRAHVQACFDREAELLVEIGKAKTKEAVEAIKWERE